MSGRAAAGPAVEAEGLGKRFGDTAALADVSFAVEPGEIFGLIGPDGAGKTTLFRLLATLLVPSAGRATVLGLDVVRGLWGLRRRLGYMPGRFSLYPDLSVEENLGFYAAVFGTTIERERERIRPVWEQIEPFRGRRAAALSGGMKQKLALCCALVHRPELLLLDEPTTGVDAVSRRELWDLLADLRAGGLTVLVSTPYMDEAGRCDRVALIHQGRLLAVDPPREIAAGFDRPLVAVAVRDRFAALAALRELPHAESVLPFGATLHLVDRRRDAPAERVAAEVRTHLAARGFADAEVAPAAATIEDVFIARMGG
ncbi:MAG TPA: ABC transporter ATP-binding protein [Thermoanaerobaculia bacterium]|nr:ABC transporter ATP-binding protein [Thermoanaerobaculia bacterium]